MEVRLVLKRKGARDSAVLLRNAENVVGRLKGCAVRVPHPEVSRRHCLLRIQHGYLTVKDLGSSNGTFLNGEPVEREEVVRPGDTLQVGPFRFVAEYHLSRDAIDRLLALADGEAAEMEVEEAVDDLPVLEDIGPATIHDSGGKIAVDSADKLPVACDEERIPSALEELAQIERGVTRHQMDLEEVEDLDPPEAEDETDPPANTATDEEAVDGWRMPDAADMRDLLSGMEDHQPPKKRPR